MVDERLVVTGVKALETMMPGAIRMLEETAIQAGDQIGIGSGIARLWSNSASFAKAGESTPALSMVARPGEAGLPELGIAFSDGGAMVANKDAISLVTADGSWVKGGLDSISARIAGGHTLEMKIENDALQVLADGKAVSNGAYLPAPFHAGINIDAGRAEANLPGGLRFSLDRYMGSTISSEARTSSGFTGPKVTASAISARHGLGGVQVGEFNPVSYPSPPAFMWRPDGELAVRTSSPRAILSSFEPVRKLATNIQNLGG